MSYHPRFETDQAGSFQTTRCRNSELWLVANKRLEDAILGYAAKYANRYEVSIYALAIEGNHIQMPAFFPKLNRAHFMRDFNSCVARAVPRFVKSYPGGRLWQRRYSGEIVPFEDLEKQFFYTVLQPIQDGLVEKLSDYPFYNCFHDAIWGVKRRYRITRWAEYNEARKNGKQVALSDYTDIATLEYRRLPGYEEMSQRDYAHLMMKKYEERRVELVRQRHAEGKTFWGREGLLKVISGSAPFKTKTSDRYSHRPRVLSDCPIRRHEWLKWYFDRYFAYQVAAQEYREGFRHVEFPPGSYKPPLLTPSQAPPGWD